MEQQVTEGLSSPILSMGASDGNPIGNRAMFDKLDSNWHR